MPLPLTFYSNFYQSILYWQKLLLILATLMVPFGAQQIQVDGHFLFDILYWQKFLVIRLYWQKFLLILAALMAPHRSPTGRGRRVRDRCIFSSDLSIASQNTPPATFPSNAFCSDSLLFQSLPKHRILTEVASNPCDNNGPTSEPNKYKSTNTFSSTSSGDLSKQSLFIWLPSIPVSPKASYTDRSSFYSLRPQWFYIGAQQRGTRARDRCMFSSDLSAASQNTPPATFPSSAFSSDPLLFSLSIASPNHLRGRSKGESIPHTVTQLPPGTYPSKMLRLSSLHCT